jgi:hypothetical protein
MNMRVLIRQIPVLFVLPALMVACASSGLAQQAESIPSHGKLKPLFDGKTFKGFDTLLKDHGINNDPNKVFQV